eukprot:CAMPEP_0182614610 /NCGR_PEP_ID=MMETSP1330-20130603/31215_1 /TAXON_ID=464278 /ORGANISM="Picochlorum sp., Strain RCC944" /LENGTH=31 /DNA_ID= /DNA_START= /DNA_END= /DNA_ORIENTATION=
MALTSSMPLTTTSKSSVSRNKFLVTTKETFM